MALYQVYISEYSYQPEHKPAKRIGVESAGYRRCVRANSRAEALDKCMSDIRAEFPKLAGSRVSVFIGRKGSVSEAASRLMPLTVDIERGEDNGRVYRSQRRRT